MELKVKGWDGITIEMYQELNSIQRENELSTIIERIAVLADCDPEGIRDLPVPEFRKAQEDISWVIDKPKPDIKTIFELDGKKYGIIPDLNFISTGEWADIENWKEDTIENLHLICALIYRPVTRYESDDDYEIEKHKPQGFERRANMFKKELSITTVFGSVLFFSASGIRFIEIIVDYLEEEAQKVKMNTMTTTQSHSKKDK